MPQTWNPASADTDTSAGYSGDGTALGTRTSNLASLFPDSPLHTGELTKSVARTAAEAFMQGSEDGDGTYGATAGVTSDSSYMFGELDLNYNGSTADPRPDVSDVLTGGGGLPASPY